MRLLVTGCMGFIARHVVKRLLDQGHSVVGVDSLDERVHKGVIPIIPEGLEFHHGSYADIPYHLLAETEVLIHLAAQVSVSDSAHDPCRYIMQNTHDTAVLLDDLKRANNLHRIVVASSMSVYGEGGVRVKEDAPVCPTSVYGLTKYDQERLCLIYGEQHRKHVAALRFFNVLGPGQALDNPYTGVMANFAKCLLNDEPPMVFEDGSQTRDFIYVEDVADAVVTVALSAKPVCSAYNVCTGEATSILSAARTLGHALNKAYIEPHLTGTKRPGDIRHCTGSPEKLQKHFNWTARTPFSIGVRDYARYLLRTYPQPITEGA